MIKVPEVVFGSSVFPLENPDRTNTNALGWAFASPETRRIVHGDGASYPLKLVRSPALPSAPRAGVIVYTGEYLVLCEDGILYEYTPSTQTFGRSFDVGGKAPYWCCSFSPGGGTTVSDAARYVFCQGNPGEIVAVRLNDGEIFRGQTRLQRIAGACSYRRRESNPEFYPDAMRSNTDLRTAFWMGPVAILAFDGRGVGEIINFTDTAGFQIGKSKEITFPANVRRVTQYDEQAPGPVSWFDWGNLTTNLHDGTVFYWANGAYLPAGIYQVSYIAGAWKPKSDSPEWVVQHTYGSVGPHILYNNGAVEVRAPGRVGSFSTPEEAVAYSSGSTYEFVHAGGTIGCYLYDSDYSLNAGTGITINLTRIA